jgi:hypothetical protein
MANQALYDASSYQVPERVLQQVRQALAATGPGTDGAQRARTLLQQPRLSYSAAKRIKSDLEQVGAAASPAYALAGGASMLAWLNQALNQARATELRRKSTRHNAGQENSFRVSHEKNTRPGVLPQTQTSTASGVRRQELFEELTPMDDSMRLAQALVSVFPTLRFMPSDEGTSVLLIAGPLSILIKAKSLPDSG